MKKNYKARPHKFDWPKYLDGIFPKGITLGKKYSVELPSFPEKSNKWIRQQVNMALHRRFPDLKADGVTVHVRIDITCPDGGTEVYVN